MKFTDRKALWNGVFNLYNCYKESTTENIRNIDNLTL